MKKIKFEKKLSLSKETIAKLNNDQLTALKGGATVGSCACPSDYNTCQYYTCQGCPAHTAVGCLTNEPTC